ncbi:hypothetical protein DUNSADRAFT_6384 [Dunaliella salina]|uniref:Uncharacterized protein n=1 Tax=Dunaliella salina TaxID=3046 RepID=A0ABQ7FU20_DUNSA|nr:hypothetical protein DUNSADRAFT_6384 [Dunaliella salina]|eukprot:KAF5825850.1 hypothetical protein DUNSADRAFT_6384 [Dunaliella salina]
MISRCKPIFCILQGNSSRRTCLSRTMSGSRFIVNRHPDYEGPPDVSQVANTELELGGTLQKVVQHLEVGLQGGLRRKATCYTGNAGIAHALWHLHSVLQANPNITIQGGSAVLATSVVPTMIHLAEQVCVPPV